MQETTITRKRRLRGGATEDATVSDSPSSSPLPDFEAREDAAAEIAAIAVASPPLSPMGDAETAADRGSGDGRLLDADQDENVDDADDSTGEPLRRRNRLTAEPSDDEDSERGDGSDVGSDDDAAEQADEWAFDYDGAAENMADLASEDSETSAAEVDRWDALARRHPNLLVQSLPHYLRPSYGMTPIRPTAEVVDLEQSQNDEDPHQEIDLTVLSSDDEESSGGRAAAVGGRDEDDDDDVEIVGTSMPHNFPTLRVASPRRKRRRANASASGTSSSTPSFDTQRAESTNVSLENNEVIEHFKKSLKCSVCLDVIDEMTSTICGHVYCGKCIRLAIRVTQKCPLCQRYLTPTDIHGLYF